MARTPRKKPAADDALVAINFRLSRVQHAQLEAHCTERDPVQPLPIAALMRQIVTQWLSSRRART